ncbi:hypothetical protein BFJ69_g6667 [Fusarium oxysporum]|uniref:AB hydrolase-1 domain-containing protein n=1 Tax=Fusarium oxysporum TaxID=5507 RepID=A0A420N8X4_FUSOX|nr:hypothetical protein BFJ69_g6667 [Fusarium oxysporum]
MATLQTVQTQFASVDGVNVAYRRFGKQNTFPLLYVNHLQGSIDVLDPLLFNIIGKNREVILYDSFGIGHSEGAVPDSTTAMAFIATKLLAAVGVSKVDVIGFSMGGRVAQILAWDDPQLIHKLVLAGTQSAIGDGVVLPSRDVLESAAGRGWGTADAIFAFTVNISNFDRLKDIKAPTLVTNGHTDVMSPTPNSFILQQKISNAQLIIYPDPGHGHLLQYPELYAQHLELFLNDL